MATKAFVIFIKSICAHGYRGLRYFYHFYLSAWLQRHSLLLSCLPVRMATKAFVIFIMSFCAHGYKGLRYLHHVHLCAWLQRLMLSLSCLSVRMSTKAFVIFIMSISALAYKGLRYLPRAYLCACIQRPYLSSVYILITSSLYKSYSIYRTCIQYTALVFNTPHLCSSGTRAVASG
jgi:hypothetical protein